MKALNPNFDLDRFLKQVYHAQQRVLFLDYDGTLAPFRVDREQAFPYAGVREILSDILKSGHSRVVIISGRYSKDLISLLGLQPLPEIWGSHGMERLRADGAYETAQLADATATALQQARQQLDELRLASQSESKPGALALHWRGLPDAKIKNIKEAVSTRWSEIAQPANLVVTDFDGGIELRAPGVNKGLAVQTVLSEMADDVAAAYLGDDLTDEDAFQAIKNKGAGILVREELRPTAADLWLQPPDELLQFLIQWHKIFGEMK